MTFGKFLSEQYCGEKLNNIRTLSVTSLVFTSSGLALAHCINLQLQEPKSHIKLKDLFWGIERFIAAKVKICRIGIWRTLPYASPLLALRLCSLNSCLHRETREPGETSDVDGIVQTLPTLGTSGFIFQPKVVLESCHYDAKTHTQEI